MPFLEFPVSGAEVDSDVVVGQDRHLGESGLQYAKLKREATLDYWQQSDSYASSGIVTFQNYSGWALKLPPYTFEPDIEFEHEDVRIDDTFGVWSTWSAIAGVDNIVHSETFSTFGTETAVTRDTAVGTTTVSRVVSWALRNDDTIEFRVHLPSNATGLSVTLVDGDGDSATYDEFEVLTDDWNLFLIEVDQPSSTSGTFDEANVDEVQISVTFSGAVETIIYIGSLVLDRTAQIGGEVLWQLSFDDGTTWVGWDGTAWSAGAWCSAHWVERWISKVTPSDYSTEQNLSIRCRLTPSENGKYTPKVYRVVCGLDFDQAFHFETDIKRSMYTAVAASEVYLRGKVVGDGTDEVTLSSHFDSPTVLAVYEGSFLAEETTADIFDSQAGNTITLTGVLALNATAIVHYKANPPVKIAADRFLTTASVPEIDLTFPDVSNDIRHSYTPESFVNRALGYVYTGEGLNFTTMSGDAFCFANDNPTVGALVDAVRNLLKSGFVSDGIGTTLAIDDMLPADIDSDHRQGLHGRRVNFSITGVRWSGLQLTQNRQVRALLTRARPLPKVGYTDAI